VFEPLLYVQVVRPVLNVRQFSGALEAAEAPAGTAMLIAAITLAAQNTRCFVIFFIVLISAV